MSIATLTNAEATLTRLEEQFLMAAEHHQRLLQLLPVKRIDLGSAANMHLQLHPDRQNEDLFATCTQQAISRIFSYPPILHSNADLIASFCRVLKIQKNIHTPPEDVVVLPGVYGGYATILRALQAKTIIVPTSMHQTHKACFANTGADLQEVPVLPDGRIDLEFVRTLLSRIPTDQCIWYLQHNTGPCITSDYINKIAHLAEMANIFCIYDADVLFTSHQIQSRPWEPLLQPAFRQRSIILANLSKEFGLPGLRIGFAICPPKTAELLHSTKIVNLEMISDVSTEYARCALDQSLPSFLTAQLCHRMKVLCQGLKILGWPIKMPASGVNLQIPVPPTFLSAFDKHADLAFTAFLMQHVGLHVRPGTLFGWDASTIRCVVCQTSDIIKEALTRMKEQGIRYDMSLSAAQETSLHALLKNCL